MKKLVDESKSPGDTSRTITYVKMNEGRLAVFVHLSVYLTLSIKMQSSYCVSPAVKRKNQRRKPILTDLFFNRPDDSHKGTFGKVLVVAGSKHYPGAPYLAAAAAQRTGVGLVTLAVPESIYATVSQKLSEATFLPLSESHNQISSSSIDTIISNLNNYDTVLIGPGLGLATETAAVVIALLNLVNNTPNINLVIDADALNIISQHQIDLKTIQCPTILTPHPGEFSRLTGLSIQEVQNNRAALAAKYAFAWNKIIILKGANTEIAAPDGYQIHSDYANSILATAGTGDLLAGIVSALLTLKMTPIKAAELAVKIQTIAARIALESIADTGVIASDLLPLIPQAIKIIKN